MPSAVAAAFNKVPTLANLVTLAQQSPKEARSAIGVVASGLKNAALPADMRAQLDAITKAQDVQLSGLVQNSTLLKSIFPDGAYTDFAACVAQATRLDSIGWNAAEAPPRMNFTGQVAKNPTSGNYELTTPGGRTYQLVSSERMSGIQPNMSAGWIAGFTADGPQPLTVQGTLSADGKSVRLEGYCPGTSGDFVFGRTKVVHPLNGPIEPMNNPPTKAQRDEIVQSGRVYVMTSRGEVEVTNPEFKALLAHVPRLGVILPLKPTETADGKLVIDQKPDFFYALGGRFKSSAQTPATDLGGGLWETQGNFAYDNFKGSVQCRGDAAKFRFENNGGQRNWLGGTFALDAAGEITHFAAEYVSKDLGEYSLNGTATDGNALQDILGGAEVTDQVANDFKRQMAPPPAPGAAA